MKKSISNILWKIVFAINWIQNLFKYVKKPLILLADRIEFGKRDMIKFYEKS